MKSDRNLTLYKRMKSTKNHEFDDKYKRLFTFSHSLKDTCLKQK